MPPHLRAFTLLELLIVLVITSLLISLAVPAFGQMIRRTHNTALASEVMVLVQYARSESIARRRVITLCGSADGESCNGSWSSRVLVFVDVNRDGMRQADEQILRTTEVLRKGDRLEWRSFGNRPYLQLHPDGRTRYQNGNFTYCPSDKNARYALHWLLNGSGRLRLAPDKNKNGVPENSGGKDIRCN